MATKSKSQRIRELLNTGMTAKQIATKVKCDPQLVYTVRWHANKKAGIAALEVAPARKGRPPKAKGTGIQQPYGRTIPEVQSEAQDVAQWAKELSQQAEYHGSMLGGGYTMPHPQVQPIMTQAGPVLPRAAQPAESTVPRRTIHEYPAGYNFHQQRRSLWDRVKDFFRG